MLESELGDDLSDHYTIVRQTMRDNSIIGNNGG